MTCIVALESEGKVYLGSDSFLGTGVIRDVIDTPKFFVKDDLVIAYAGGVRPAQLVEHDLKVRKRRKNESDMTYLINVVVESIKKALERHGVPTQPDKSETDFIIVYQHKIYVLQGDFSLVRSNLGFAAIGVGQDYAYGALTILSKLQIPSQTKVQMALEAAEKMCPQVCAPFHIVEV
jgi:ATP-dependent protease HslVU (ClpYQ) peptidase subunit